MLKKLLVSIVLVIYTLFALVPHVSVSYAQTQWWNPTLGDFNAKVSNPSNNEIFGERYTYAQVTWIMYSLVLFLVNNKIVACTTDSNPQAVKDCLTPLVPLSNNINFSSPILAAGSLVDIFRTTKPASGVAWTKNLAANYHLIPEAKAQATGYGFTTLGMGLKLWQASRNFSYALMTLAIVILAFMIMFRVKISPQLSVSIQSAVPKVALGLVLITFSYAIAGFLIDLAYLSQGIVALMFKSANITTLDTVLLFQRINNGSMGMLSLGIAYILAVLLVVTGAGVGLGAIGAIFTGGGAAAPVVVTTAIAGIIIGLILLVAFIIAALRIFWLLLRTYISVILLVISTPFQILLATASPQGSLFGWIRGLLANIAVFPAVSILILFAHTLFWGSLGGDSFFSTWPSINPFGITTNNFTASSSGTFPTFIGVSTELIGFFGALVLLLSIPSIVNSIRQFISTGRAQAPEAELGILGAAAGYAIGAGTSGIQRAAGTKIGNIAGAQGQNILNWAANTRLMNRAYPGTAANIRTAAEERAKAKKVGQ